MEPRGPPDGVLVSSNAHDLPLPTGVPGALRKAVHFLEGSSLQAAATAKSTPDSGGAGGGAGESIFVVVLLGFAAAFAAILWHQRQQRQQRMMRAVPSTLSLAERSTTASVAEHEVELTEDGLGGRLNRPQSGEQMPGPRFSMLRGPNYNRRSTAATVIDMQEGGAADSRLSTSTLSGTTRESLSADAALAVAPAMQLQQAKEPVTAELSKVPADPSSAGEPRNSILSEEAGLRTAAMQSEQDQMEENALLPSLPKEGSTDAPEPTVECQPLCESDEPVLTASAQQGAASVAVSEEQRENADHTAAATTAPVAEPQSLSTAQVSTSALGEVPVSEEGQVASSNNKRCSTAAGAAVLAAEELQIAADLIDEAARKAVALQRKSASLSQEVTTASAQGGVDGTTDAASVVQAAFAAAAARDGLLLKDKVDEEVGNILRAVYRSALAEPESQTRGLSRLSRQSGGAEDWFYQSEGNADERHGSKGSSGPRASKKKGSRRVSLQDWWFDGHRRPSGRTPGTMTFTMAAGGDDSDGSSLGNCEDDDAEIIQGAETAKCH